jgi:uncharacterized protein YjbJ (UPF0337 family)
MKDIRDRDLIQDNWDELRPLIHQRWPEISHNELDLIQGQTDMLIGILQEHYGVTREEAAQQAREFEREHQARLRRLPPGP